MIAFGISFSIDDFGTGYSTLQQISRYQGKLIKIDRSFVVDIATNNYNKAIIAAISSMGNTLGIPIVAEGVETQSQYDLIRGYGIPFIQGYYFYKPMELDQLIQVIKENRH